MPIQPIIFFDGVCVLCNGLARFIVRIDKRRVFLFATLDSHAAKEYLSVDSERQPGTESIMLWDKGSEFVRSGAVFEVLRRIGWPWKLLLILHLLPEFLLDKWYDYVARKRYRWFGKYENCPIPPSEMRARILD